MMIQFLKLNQRYVQNVQKQSVKFQFGFSFFDHAQATNHKRILLIYQ